PRPRRLLRRGRPDRRRSPLGHGDRDDRSGLLRPHVLGVPPARRRERRYRMEAPAGAGEAAARGRSELAPPSQLCDFVSTFVVPPILTNAGAFTSPPFGCMLARSCAS